MRSHEEMKVGMISDSCDMNGGIEWQEWLGMISVTQMHEIFFNCFSKLERKLFFAMASILHKNAYVMTVYKVTDTQLGNKHTLSIKSMHLQT